MNGVRTRILAWYVVLSVLTSLGSIGATSQIFHRRLEQQTERAQQNDIQTFRTLLQDLNPATGKPFAQDMALALDFFVSRYQPLNRHDYAIAFLEGQVYRASVTTDSEQITENEDLVTLWLSTPRSQQGKAQTALGRITYIVEPIPANGSQPQGVLVLISRLTEATQGIDSSLWVVIQTSMGALGIGAILAWISAGQVLDPLRSLDHITKQISESDLSQRIPIQGSDELAELAHTFNQMLDRLQAAFSSQQEFIKDASHELRTPITIIRGHLELMGSDPDEQRETLTLVMEELSRMNRFVDDLLLLTQAERPDFLRERWVDLASFTQGLYAKAQGLALRDWQLEAVGSGCIWIDPERITQAVMNLAENATHYSQSGDPIILGSGIVAQQIHFWVKDHGEGIPLADQQRIFDRFARSHESTRRSDGAGLGLSIVQSIVKAHGGSIDLKSQVAEGSTFLIRLPLVTPAAGLASPRLLPSVCSG